MKDQFYPNFPPTQDIKKEDFPCYFLFRYSNFLSLSVSRVCWKDFRNQKLAFLDKEKGRKEGQSNEWEWMNERLEYVHAFPM